MSDLRNYSRKDFIKTTGALAGGAVLASPYMGKAANLFREKRKMALVGTGVRGISMFGRRVR
ncbi:MAG: gfo/Idh/MocA family oxidoreductase, partial [Balneolaceae bacterium]